MFTFVPNGLEISRTYEVRFDNRDASVKVAGIDLMTRGLPIRLENIGMSELLLFTAV